ncbi:MAG: hypothetical protein FWC97_00180 [Treponema sp.]|nr:hypothetical protein [Treponema sp.]
MNKETWNTFQKTREQFRNLVNELSESLPGLRDIQQEFVNNRSENAEENSNGNSVYTVETPVVYNTALDDITINDEIKLILVADNPGRREQLAENRRYLVGPSGKIAQKFFRDNPSLGIDFQKNVIILNKTPIHTPRTADLRKLCRVNNEQKTKNHQILGLEQLSEVLKDSQKTMAELLFKFHEAFGCPVWIIGYSEMRNKGIFEVYTESLKQIYTVNKNLYKHIYLYRHFSMNQFTIDLNKQALPEETTAKSLKRIGTAYKQRILGL